MRYSPKIFRFSFSFFSRLVFVLVFVHFISEIRTSGTPEQPRNKSISEKPTVSPSRGVSHTELEDVGGTAMPTMRAQDHGTQTANASKGFSKDGSKPSSKPQLETLNHTVILVYSLDSCSGENHNATSGTNPQQTNNGGNRENTPGVLELQTRRRTRDVAFSALEQRTAYEAAKRGYTQHIRYRRHAYRNLSATFEQSPANVLQFDDSDQISLRLKTRYLNTLQMEITEVPEYLTSEDILEFVKDIPCIKLAHNDYVKTIPTNDEILATNVGAKPQSVSNTRRFSAFCSRCGILYGPQHNVRTTDTPRADEFKQSLRRTEVFQNSSVAPANLYNLAPKTFASGKNNHLRVGLR